jgi:cellulose biosynthesis protein BcsQ
MTIDLLFAAGDAAPTWTNKEVIIAGAQLVGVTLTVGAPFVMFLLRHFTENARRAEREKFRNEVDRVDCGNEPTAKDDLEVTTGYHIGQLEAQLNSAQCEVERLTDEYRTTKLTALEHKQGMDVLQKNLENVKKESEAIQANYERYRRRIQRAVSKEGLTWTEKTPAGATPFKSLDERCTPVIATLNLKGGVGKTTATANLGVALSSLGYRVLLVDLDLQGSLTSLFVSMAQRDKAVKEGRLLGDFLFASFDRESPRLPDYFLPIEGADGSFIVPTTDNLAYAAETNLALRWRLREHRTDPRFLLRRELQLKRVYQAFDVILLDCPPFLNMCCVNALTAADYVIVPVLPSKQATDRVPKLLSVVKEVRENLNSDLKIMGILPIRTHQTGMTAGEKDRFSALRRTCRDVWGQDVPQFERYIPQNVDIRDAEDEGRPLSPSDKLYPLFQELAREFDGRLPTFCQPKNKNLATIGADG